MYASVFKSGAGRVLPPTLQVWKVNPNHDAAGLFTSAPASRATRSELLKSPKLSYQKLAELMDTKTEGHIDVQGVKDQLKAGGMLYLETKAWPLSKIAHQSMDKEVDPKRATASKGSVIIGKDGFIVDGRHRVAQAIAQGKTHIAAWVPAEALLATASDVKKADYAHVLKTNPFRDANGKFSSKDKASYQGGKVFDNASSLSGMLTPGLDADQHKAIMNTKAGNFIVQHVGISYAKYVKHTEANGEKPEPLSSYLKQHMDTGTALTAEGKIKASMASAKAWTKIYKKKALETVEGDEFVGLMSKAQDGDNKAISKLADKTALLKKQYTDNGGDEKDFDSAYSASSAKATKINTTMPGDMGLEAGPETQLKDLLVKKPPKAPAQAPDAPAKPSDSPLPPTVAPAPAKGLYADLEKNWKTPKDTADALAQNGKLGEAYYVLRDKHGKDHPETLAVYAEWQKSKDHLKENSPSTSVSDLSSKSKSAAQSKIAQHKEKALADKSSLTGQYAMLHQLENTPGTKPSVLSALKDSIEKTKNKGKEDGTLEQSDIISASAAGKKNAQAVVEKSKAKALDDFNAAVYAQSQHKDTNSKEFQKSADDLAKAFDKAQAHGYDVESLKSAAAGTKAKVATDAKKAAAFTAALGDHKDVIAKMDKTAFVEVDGSKASAAYKKHVLDSTTSLTKTEEDAIRSYTNSGYTSQNKNAAGTGGASADASVKVISKAFAKRTLGEDLKLRRNAAQKWFWDALGVSEKDMHDMTSAQLEKFTGKTYTEKAFSSTSKDLNFTSTFSSTASKSGAIALMIRAPKTIRGLDVKHISSHEGESEVVLDKGVTYVIRSIRPAKNIPGSTIRYIADVDAIGHLDS